MVTKKKRKQWVANAGARRQRIIDSGGYNLNILLGAEPTKQLNRLMKAYGLETKTALIITLLRNAPLERPQPPRVRTTLRELLDDQRKA